jgi:hypothetical protein
MTTATEHVAPPSPASSVQSRWITDWRAEGETFCAATGKTLAFRQSFLSYKNGNAAYGAFLVLYAACFAVTYVVYLRSGRRPTTVA